MTADRRDANDRRPRQERAQSARPRREDGGRAPGRADAGMRAARRAARHVQALTGREPENVVSVERNEDGWHIGVEILELRRVPATTDILAVYEVVLDGRGELVGYRRGSRYQRSSASGRD